MSTNRYAITDGNLRVDYETGSSSIDLSAGIIKPTRISHVGLHMSAAPTTSENFTIGINSVSGSAFDTTLYKLDLSSCSTTDLMWYPEEKTHLQPGDAIDVAYDNTDAGIYGVQITVIELI